MMYKCCECGHLFEEGEQAVWEERHGLDRGPYEKWSGCPLCNVDYEEVHQCKECFRWHSEDELYNGLCSECIEKIVEEFRYSPEKCYKISNESNSTEPVDIDSFLATMFTTNQINEILFKELINASKTVKLNCSRFIDSDKEWFIDAVSLEKEVK